jgi:hypothetical protein
VKNMNFLIKNYIKNLFVPRYRREQKRKYKQRKEERRIAGAEWKQNAQPLMTDERFQNVEPRVKQKISERPSGSDKKSKITPKLDLPKKSKLVSKKPGSLLLVKKTNKEKRKSK